MIAKRVFLDAAMADFVDNVKTIYLYCCIQNDLICSIPLVIDFAKYKCKIKARVLYITGKLIAEEYSNNTFYSTKTW